MRLAARAAAQRNSEPELSNPGSREALHALLAYRLPLHGSIRAIKQEWMEILEGKHHLWQGIDPEKRECVRGFLVQFESDILHRAHRNFNFRGGSIGNFFLAAMQRFFRSIQSAIFLFSALTDIPSGASGSLVLPAINTNKTTTIAARLADNSLLVGQCEISHPPNDSQRQDNEWSTVTTRRPSFEQQDTSVGPEPLNYVQGSALLKGSMNERVAEDLELSDEDEFPDDLISDPAEELLNHQGAHSESLGNIAFAKSDIYLPLPSPIKHLFYVNSVRNEVFPPPNPAYIDSLLRGRMLVYSCGSFWTSIMPCLMLRGVPRAIATSPTLKHKIFLLNSEPDRETAGLTAVDLIKCVIYIF